jgi:hypothetical protein
VSGVSRHVAPASPLMPPNSATAATRKTAPRPSAPDQVESTRGSRRDSRCHGEYAVVAWPTRARRRVSVSPADGGANSMMEGRSAPNLHA